MTADVLFSYLFGMDWLLLSSFAFMVATVAVAELGQELWTGSVRDPEAARLPKTGQKTVGSRAVLSGRH
jgi:hypothetical protein